MIYSMSIRSRTRPNVVLPEYYPPAEEDAGRLLYDQDFDPEGGYIIARSHGENAANAYFSTFQ